MPSFTSVTATGPISAPQNSTWPWPSTPAAHAASDARPARPMRQRAISAVVLVPVVAIPFVLGNPWLTFGIAALALLGGAEAASLIRRAGLPADPGIPI